MFSLRLNRRAAAGLLCVPLIVGVGVGADPARAEVGDVIQYELPNPASDPRDVVPGPNNALWLTDCTGNSIVEFTPGATSPFTNYPLPHPKSCPDQIALGPDGALWFTENGRGGNRIGRINRYGLIEEFPLPSLPSYLIGMIPPLGGITAGPDDALWYTSPSRNVIGRISLAGGITEYSVPTYENEALSPAQPDAIATGPDGALWFTESMSDQLGRITTNGSLTFFAAESPVPGPKPGITVGPDQALWFTEQYGWIGRMTTGGSVESFAVPPPGPSYESGPTDIAVAAGGSLWFTDQGAGPKVVDAVGTISSNGSVTQYPVPPVGSNYRSFPDGITAGANGLMWFAAEDAIGSVQTYTSGPGSTGSLALGSHGFTVGSDSVTFRSQVTTPAPGKIRHKVTSSTGRRLKTHCRAQVKADESGEYKLACATDRRLIRALHHRRQQIMLTTTFTPDHGQRVTASRTDTLRRR